MPQISKRPIKPDIQDSITQAFEEILIQIKSKSTALDFMKRLLTITERVMLAKRLAIMLLLKQNYSYQEIKRILMVSQSTISTVKRMVENQSENEFNKLIDHLIRQKENRIKFLILLNSLTDSILPPKSQSWSSWRKRQWDTKRQVRKKKYLPY